MKKIIIIMLTITLILFSGCENFENQNNSTNQIANPASVYCGEEGGKLEIRNSDDGQIGYCIFEDFECEEWKFYRGECPDKKSQLGEFCGGIQAVQCDDSLKCEYDGDFPDAGGTCVNKNKITNFDECIAAGNPIMESYPAQCIANNRTFYEKIEQTNNICNMEYSPVCGVDGRSYSNKCMAGNVTIAYKGECE